MVIFAPLACNFVIVGLFLIQHSCCFLPTPCACGISVPNWGLTKPAEKAQNLTTREPEFPSHSVRACVCVCVNILIDMLLLIKNLNGRVCVINVLCCLNKWTCVCEHSD